MVIDIVAADLRERGINLRRPADPDWKALLTHICTVKFKGNDASAVDY